MAWADVLARMDSRVMAHLRDGCAQYVGPAGGPVVAGVEVIVSRELMQNGPDGMFRSSAVGFSWRKDELAKVERGGVFTFCRARYLVEEQISDDGYFVIAACMEIA